ncbi:hypothetical protein V6U90_11015 [Micromonospora sp. CPCC 206060]|uniref:hypothetical protein n=1 Tax=Micromonospora sp. CPCC 206060 TaxID=3122406 RepID=UPI002FEEFFCA
MGGEEPYFGYTTADNTLLLQNRQLARRMGEDIRYYPAPENGEYIEPTINWEDPRFSDADQERSNQLFANDSIEKIYQRVMAQNANAVREVADQWYRVSQVIQDISDRVLNAARGLKYGGDGSPGNSGGWTGQGADAFLARGPGATLKSLDEWRSAAITNWLGSLSLASTITSHQSRMSSLYEQYKQAMVTFGNEWQERNLGDVPVEDAGPTAQDKYVTALRTEQIAWSKRAQQIQYEMARSYWSIMSEDLAGGRATVYEGPTDAVQPNPEFLARYMRGRLPSIGNPSRVGTPNVTTPTISTRNVPTPDANLQRTVSRLVAEPTVPGQDQGRQQTTPTPEITVPDVGMPTVPTPTPTLPVVPPVVPAVGNLPVRGVPTVPGVPGVPGTGQPGTGSLPGSALARGTNLLGDARAGGVPGVLRGVPAVPGAPGEGLPPSPPQNPARGAPGGPQTGGRGPQRTISAAPPGSRQSVPPGTSLPPGTPSTPRAGAPGPDARNTAGPAVPGGGTRTNQFGSPPAAPSSPVLRAPRTTAPIPPQGAPTRRGPLAHDAAPPVLNRPRTAGTPDTAHQLTPQPGGGPRRDAPLAPPTPPTTRPVVGRSATTPAPGTPRPAEPANGVLRGARRPAGYQAELGSRRKERERDEKAARVDRDFDQIRRLLDREEAWTVATPGGGVLDSTPTRATRAAAEPKPTVGGGA